MKKSKLTLCLLISNLSMLVVMKFVFHNSYFRDDFHSAVQRLILVFVSFLLQELQKVRRLTTPVMLCIGLKRK